MIEPMKPVTTQTRIENARPAAAWMRNGRDAVYEVCRLIIDQEWLTDDIQIDRWINEGGALPQLQLTVRPS